MRWAVLYPLAMLFAASSAYGAEHELYAFGAADASPTPAFTAHGIAFLGWRVSDLPYDHRLSVVYNTDTLTAQYDRICFPPACVGIQLQGEFGIAGLLPDYFQNGQKRDEGGFSASFLSGTGFVEIPLLDRQYLDYRLTVRKWFFASLDQTDPNLVLPPEATVIEQWLGFTYWSFEADPSQWEWHRTQLRFSGIGLGLRGGVDFRDTARPWGLPEDPRNAPERTIIRVRQWARYGAYLARGLRFQFSEEFGWGHGDDDLTRRRVGGLNPYVAPVGGIPWAAFLASKYVAGRMGLHLRLFGESEVGVFADGAVVDDPQRLGDSDFGGLAGFGVLFDLRFGKWQIDLQGAWGPTVGALRDSPYVSAYLAVGYRIL